VSEATVARASALLDVGRVSEATSLLRKALSQSPDAYDLLCLLSEAHLQASEYDEVVRVAERAIAVDPEDARAYYNAAVALSFLKRHREAIEVAEEAVRLAPMEWWTHAGLATALARKRDRLFSRKFASRAMAEARSAVELAPEEPDAHFVVGYCANRAHRRREAKAAYERVLSLQPEHPAAFHNLSTLQIRLGRPIAAARGLRSAAAEGGLGDLARHNIDALGMVLLWFTYGALWALCLLLGLLDERHCSRLTYVIVDSSVLLLLVVVAVVSAYRLPQTVRAYYRRLVRRNGWFALRSFLILVAFGALVCSAALAGNGLRDALRSTAKGCLAWALLIGWLQVWWVKRRAPDDRVV